MCVVSPSATDLHVIVVRTASPLHSSPSCLSDAGLSACFQSSSQQWHQCQCSSIPVNANSKAVMILPVSLSQRQTSLILPLATECKLMLLLCVCLHCSAWHNVSSCWGSYWLFTRGLSAAKDSTLRLSKKPECTFDEKTWMAGVFVFCFFAALSLFSHHVTAV